MRGAYAWADEEEAEYAVLLVAAEASLELLRGDPAAPRRRVVVAGEVDAALVRPGTGAAVVVPAALRLDQVHAVLVDDAAAGAVVRRALDGRTPVPDGLDLQWFAIQELAVLLEP